MAEKKILEKAEKIREENRDRITRMIDRAKQVEEPTALGWGETPLKHADNSAHKEDFDALLRAATEN